MRLTLREMSQLHHVERLLDALLPGRGIQGQPFDPIADIAFDRHVRKKRIRLKHHVDRPLVRRHTAHFNTVDRDRAAALARESRQHAQQRSLPAPGSSHERKHLALVDLQVDVVDRSKVAVGLDHAVDDDLRLGARVEPGAIGNRFELGCDHA